MPKLDRIPSPPDPRRQLNYPIRALLPEPDTFLPFAKYWTEGYLLDQGNEGACVGHGWTAELMASPARTHIGPDWDKAYSRLHPNDFAYKYYERARQLDPWPGEDYEGTSVEAGAQVARERGLVTEFRWGESILDVRDTLMFHGPVVIGINWYDLMYDTDTSGLVTVGGEIVGGHCILLTGYSPARYFRGTSGPLEVVRWRNSWGSSYGLNGHGFIRLTDLTRLLFEENGEVCVPVRRVSGNV